MSIADLKKSLKVLRSFRPSLHRQKIDDLNEQQRLAATCLLHDVHELPQTRNETIVANTQQRSTRNVAHSSRLDHQHRRSPLREPSIPIEILLSDKPIFSRAPRHHRRNPRPAACLESSDFYGSVEKRYSGVFGGWPVSFFDSMTDWVRKLPHVRAANCNTIHRLNRF